MDLNIWRMEKTDMNGKNDKKKILDIPDGVGEADIIEFYIKRYLEEKHNVPDNKNVSEDYPMEQ